MKHTKLSLLGVIEYIFVVVLILDCNSVFHAAVDFDLHLPILSAALSVLLVIISSSKISINDFFVSFGLLLFFTTYFIVKNDSVAKESYICMFLIGVPLLTTYFSRMRRENRIHELFFKIENVVVILAFISVIIWLLGPVSHIISPNCSINVNWGMTTKSKGYYYLVFEMTQDKTYGIGLVQNNAFFTEAPMLNLWLDIAIGTELFLKKESSKKRLVILLSCVLSTISTTAILFVVICFMLKFFSTRLIGSMTRKKIVMYVLAIVLLPLVINFVVEILTIKSMTGSYKTRMMHFVAGYLMWRDNPIFGSGYGNLRSFLTGGYTTYTAAGGQGFSNSVTAILGTGGLWNTSIYLFAIIRPFIAKYEDKINILCFIACYVYLSITTIFFARYLQAVFIAYGMSFFHIEHYAASLFGNSTEGIGVKRFGNKEIN